MLSVVVPTYQERRALDELLPRLAAVRRGLPEGLEVLVVDGGSSDGTVEFAERFLAQEQLGRVIRREPPTGLAQAVMLGVQQAQGAWIGVMDADLSHPPEVLPTLMRAVQAGAELAVASRYVEGGRITDWPWPRRVLSRLGNLLARPLVHVADATSGYFVAEAALLKQFSHAPRGFKILLELLVRGGIQRVQEIPYAFTDRQHGRSKLGLRTLWWYALQLGRLYGYRLAHPRSTVPHACGERPVARQDAPGRQRLSAVILTKNEEARITRCLESIRWADEIIVVDGLSTDRTVEICQRYGATIIARPFSGSFGEERNVGAEAASGEWILQLDGDDVVSEELRDAIGRLLTHGTPHAAFNIRRKNNFLGHWMMRGGWHHYYHMFYRKAACRFEGRVHHLLKVTGTIGTLEAPVLHFPFTSLEQFVARQNRYTSLEAKELFDEQGVLDRRAVRYQLTWRPVKLFWKSYVKKQGFREGWYGLVFALLYSWVHFLKWAKYWELVRGHYHPEPAVTIAADTAQAAVPDTVAGARHP